MSNTSNKNNIYPYINKETKKKKKKYTTLSEQLKYLIDKIIDTEAKLIPLTYSNGPVVIVYLCNLTRLIIWQPESTFI